MLHAVASMPTGRRPPPNLTRRSMATETKDELQDPAGIDPVLTAYLAGDPTAAGPARRRLRKRRTGRDHPVPRLPGPEPHGSRRRPDARGFSRAFSRRWPKAPDVHGTIRVLVRGLAEGRGRAAHDRPPASGGPGGGPRRRHAADAGASAVAPERRRRPEAAMQGVETAERLVQALAQLGPKDRLLAELHLVRGRSLDHVAEVLGVTMNAAYVRKSRVVERLRRMLGTEP